MQLKLIKNFGKSKKHHKKITIIDFIYPIVKLKERTYEIKDHINLSGLNPLKGPIFLSLSKIYKPERLKKNKNRIIVAGLKKDIIPNVHERKILLKAGIKAYCYNLVPVVISAAYKGYEIHAFGIVK